MGDPFDLELARMRREELLREAGERRLARTLRVGPFGGRDELRDAVSGSEEVRVRWGLAEDEPAVADLLQLNGMPRWVAFEERFIVAERDGKVLGALRYRTESKRLLLGLLVVDPSARSGWRGHCTPEPETWRGSWAWGRSSPPLTGLTIRGRPGTGGGGATGAWTPLRPASPTVWLLAVGVGSSPCSARSPCLSTDTGSGRGSRAGDGGGWRG